MSLASGFTTAWKDLKKAALTAAAFVGAHGAAIQTGITTVAQDVALVDPAIAPAVTVFDNVEEDVMGAVLAVASDTTKAKTLQDLFGTAWPTIEALVGQLKAHPAVAQASVPATPAA